MIITQHTLSHLQTAFKASFALGFAGVAPLWGRVATEVPSNTASEDYAWLGDWPSLREWIGDRQVKNLAEYGYSIRNKKFESTVGVPRTKLEDDQYGIYGRMMEGMGQSAARYPDEHVFAALATGFITACYDGQYFFDTDHPVQGASVANTDGGSGNAWFLLDTSRSLKPLIFQKRQAPEFQQLTQPNDESVVMRDEYLYGVRARSNVGYGFWPMAWGSKQALDAERFAAARAAMMAITGDTGQKLGVNPDLLICGPSNMAAAEALLETQFLTGGGTNTNYKKVALIVTPYLD